MLQKISHGMLTGQVKPNQVTGWAGFWALQPGPNPNPPRGWAWVLDFGRSPARLQAYSDVTPGQLGLGGLRLRFSATHWHSPVVNTVANRR